MKEVDAAWIKGFCTAMGIVCLVVALFGFFGA